MVLDYNEIFEDIKEFLIYGVKDEGLFKEELKRIRLYRGESADQWPGGINFNYIFVSGKNLKGTVRLMIKQGAKERIPKISKSLEIILNQANLKELSKISIPKFDIRFNKNNRILEMDYRVNGRINSLYLSPL